MVKKGINVKEIKCWGYFCHKLNVEGIFANDSKCSGHKTCLFLKATFITPLKFVIIKITLLYPIHIFLLVK